MKQLESKKANEIASQDDANVPDNWEMVAEESKLTEATSKEKDNPVITDCKIIEEDPSNTHVSTSLHPHNLTSIPCAAEVSLRENADDHIVLGPGGQWGLQNDRPSLRLNHGRDGEGTVVPRVPAWSLPTLRQQWEFSEITHHGRKKQKSLHRKKKKSDD